MAVVTLRTATSTQNIFNAKFCVLSFLIGYYISFFFYRFLITYDSKLKSGIMTVLI